jgi:hypothetical protein
LTREQVVPGGFDTEGVVASQFVPQVACPDPGTPCAPKPQLPRHIVLVGDDPAKGLLVAVPESTAFAVGARYRVSVVVCGTRFSGARINEGYLRAVEPAE